LIVRELATTAQFRFRYPATRPAPMPPEAPVMMATLRVVMVTIYSTNGGLRNVKPAPRVVRCASSVNLLPVTG
jgi:hypothetical protein